jgi:hypothetical protein
MSEMVNPISGKKHALVSRSDSRLRAPRQRYALASTAAGTFTHYDYARPTSSLEEGKARALWIQSFHMDTNGWFDAAYNFGVDNSGRIYELRGWGIANGATMGYGSTSHAFVWFGGFGGTQPTNAALDALFCLEATEDVLYARGRPHRPHLRVNPTSCPGPTLVNWCDNRLAPLLAGSPAPRPPAPAPSPVPAPSRCKWKHQQARVLRPNPITRGNDAAEWQFILNVANGTDRHRWVAVDGAYGPATAAETRRAQQIYSTFFRPISVDGIVGQQTRNAMCEMLIAKGIW